MVFILPTRRERLRLYTRWAYWRQVGPMYRVTMWWLNRKAAGPVAGFPLNHAGGDDRDSPPRGAE